MKEKILGVVAGALFITVFILVAECVALLTPATWTIKNIAYVASALLAIIIIGVNVLD